MRLSYCSEWVGYFSIRVASSMRNLALTSGSSVLFVLVI